MATKGRIVLAFFIALSLTGFAQSSGKKILSIEDVSINPRVYPQFLSQLNWIPGTDTYAQVEDQKLNQYSGAKGKLIKSISVEDLNAAIEKVNKDDVVSRMPGVAWQDSKHFTFRQNQKLYSITIGRSLVAKMEFEYKTGASGLEYQFTSGGAGNHSYVIGDDLYVNGIQINESEEGVVYGQVVHRNEFGINKGTFWSADFSKLAFYQNDQRAVTDYPMLNITKPVAEDYHVKYPMAGQQNETVKLGIYDVKSKKTLYLKTGDVDQYLTNITWDPSGKFVYIGVLNRGQDHLKWQKYSVSNGELVSTLFEEKSESFVEPLHPLKFNPTNSEEFIWQSWRDGYTHLYRYNTDGKLLNQITKGAFEVNELVCFSSDGKSVFYTSREESPLETHLYEISIQGGTAKKVTGVKGSHSVKVSDKSHYVIDIFSTREIARKYALLKRSGKEVKELLLSKDPMADYEKNAIEFGTIKAGDGSTDLYTRMIKPYNFDATKKYPAIVYVYGGSHAQMVTESWMGGASLFLHYMAQQGYIVFTVDNRGSDNRGAAFEQATHRQLGTLEIEDQLAGVDYLKKQAYIDADRIGVHGWSFGGFMTTGLMLKAPGTFKVGVCGGPVIDWKYYEIMYTERYMDTPEENPEGYETSSLLNHVKNLEGKLLIVHGADDDVVVWQHTLAFIDECVENAVLFDYFPYPGHKHHVRGRDRVHLQKYMAQYFIDHL